MKRRSAMQLVVIGAAVGPVAAQHAGQHAPAEATEAAAKLRFFSMEQNALVDRLAEMIIPADKHSGGAHEAKVSVFIDNLLADSGAAEQQAWSGALLAVDAEATKRYAKALMQCTDAQAEELLKDMAQEEGIPRTELQRFFVKLKTQTLSGYYTSSVGLLKDLEYKGIVPIAVYPACDHPDHLNPQKRDRN